MAKVYGKNSFDIFSIPLFIFFFSEQILCPILLHLHPKDFSSAFLISSILSRQLLRGKVSIRNICLITTSYYVVCTNSE
jgi:hypothetical protein